MSKYEVISGPDTGKQGLEITPYLDTFHAVWNTNNYRNYMTNNNNNNDNIREATCLYNSDYISNNDIGETIDIYSESLFEITAIFVYAYFLMNN